LGRGGNITSSSGLIIRWGAIGFMLGGLVWVVPDLLLLGVVSWGVWFASRLVGFALLALGLVGLHALQGGSYGGVGQVGFYTAFGATVTHLLSSLAIYLLQPLAVTPFALLLALAALLSLVAKLGYLVGFVLLGVATWRVRLLARWYGVLLIIFALVLVAVDANRGFRDYEWPGLVLGVLGYGLWVRRETSAQPPTRVS
jgi:hypothetical protein